jgi:hypothetical protein
MGHMQIMRQESHSPPNKSRKILKRTAISVSAQHQYSGPVTHLKYIRVSTVTLLKLIETKLPIVFFVEGAKDLIDKLHRQHTIELQSYRKEEQNVLPHPEYSRRWGGSRSCLCHDKVCTWAGRSEVARCVKYTHLHQRQKSERQLQAVDPIINESTCM